MKLKLILLFFLVQAGFAFSQTEAFDPNYYGSYKSEDDNTYIYIYSLVEADRLDLTEEQKKNAVFLFSYQTLEAEGMSVAMKKGSNYVSLVNEFSPEFLFSFKNLDGVQTLEITEKSGKKISLTKFILDQDPYYYEEETDSGYDYVPDEENGYYGYYGDEETETATMRVYSRSDGAELAVIFTEETFLFAVGIPATKSCSEIMIEGELIGGGEEGMYIYNDPEGKFVLNLFEMENTMEFECASGDCFDKKGKCGIWNEPFILNNE